MHIPTYALDALRAVQVVAPEAVIAGGFIRDTYAAVAPKDLDVFVGPRCMEEFQARGFSVTPVFIADDHSGYGRAIRDEVYQVFNVIPPTLGRDAVQVVALRRPLGVLETLERMDFDFCQAAFDGVGLTYTPAFLMAHAMKRATCLVTDPTQVRRSKRRVESWRPRYSEWDFRFPTDDTEKVDEWLRTNPAGVAPNASQACGWVSDIINDKLAEYSKRLDHAASDTFIALQAWRL